MRRMSTVLIAAAIVTAMAVPVGAAPSKCEADASLPGCAPSNEDPPIAANSVDVYMDAEPLWAHEAADVIKYHVTLENKTGELIDDVTVRFTAAYPQVLTEVVENVEIPENGSYGEGFWRTVSEFEEAEPCLTDVPGVECALLANVEVLIGDSVVAQTEMSTALLPEPACGFTAYGDDWVSDSVTMNGLCIWTLPEEASGKVKTGVWEITLRPILPDPEARKPSGAWMDVRDGVPGNWCTLAIGDSWGFSDRWKAPYPPDPTLTGHVYLPGDENLPVDPEHEDYPALGLDEGMCISGGAGGDYFKVGNPKAFYLRADGDVPVNVTVKWVSEGP